MTDYKLIEITKTCFRCKSDKDLCEFGKNKRTKTGLSVYCKQCNNELGRENRLRIGKDKIRQVNIGYRKRNKDKIKKHKKNAYIKNRNEILDQHKQYRMENKEQISKRRRIASKKQADILHDTYIKSVIIGDFEDQFGVSIPSKDIPIDLIEIKRLSILTKRKLKQAI
jgi:hypothetical protein